MAAEQKQRKNFEETIMRREIEGSRREQNWSGREDEKGSSSFREGDIGDPPPEPPDVVDPTINGGNSGGGSPSYSPMEEGAGGKGGYWP